MLVKLKELELSIACSNSALLVAVGLIVVLVFIWHRLSK